MIVKPFERRIDDLDLIWFKSVLVSEDACCGDDSCQPSSILCFRSFNESQIHG